MQILEKIEKLQKNPITGDVVYLSMDKEKGIIITNMIKSLGTRKFGFPIFFIQMPGIPCFKVMTLFKASSEISSPKPENIRYSRHIFFRLSAISGIRKKSRYAGIKDRLNNKLRFISAEIKTDKIIEIRKGKEMRIADGTKTAVLSRFEKARRIPAALSIASGISGRAGSPMLKIYRHIAANPVLFKAGSIICLLPEKFVISETCGFPVSFTSNLW